MTNQYLIDAGIVIIGIIAGVLGHKWHLSQYVPKALRPIEQEAKKITQEVVRVVENATADGHEAVIAHNAAQAATASESARLAQQVDALILQYAGAAGKSVASLTGPDIQNVIAYVLHTLSPSDVAKVAPKTVTEAHAKLVVAHNALAASDTFKAAQVAATYQAEASSATATAAKKA